MLRFHFLIRQRDSVHCTFICSFICQPAVLKTDESMLTLMMTSAKVVETSVSVITNSPSQDYTHPDDLTLPTYDMTPGFKPFTALILCSPFQTHIK